MTTGVFDELQKQAKDAKTNLMAFFGNEEAKQQLQKQKEDKIIAKYFGDIVTANKKYSYSHRDVIMSDDELRQYARKIQAYENGEYEKNTEANLTQRLVSNVHSLAEKRQFDMDVVLYDSAAILVYTYNNDNYKKYEKLQEYVSFDNYSAVADLGKDFLQGLDKALQESGLTEKELTEYRKLYGGKSFTEIYNQYHNTQTANTEKKSMDNKKGEYWTGVYR